MLAMKFRKAVIGLGIMVGSSTLFAANSIEESDWYVHIDVQSLKSSQLRENVKPEANKGLSVAEALLGKEFVNNTKYITVYGDISENKNKTVLARGNYGSLKADLIERLNKLGLSEKSSAGSTDIFSGQIKEVDVDQERIKDESGNEILTTNVQIEEDNRSDLTLHAAFISNDTLAIGPSKDEIIRLAQNVVKWNPEALQSLFEVVVDVEKAMVHGGVNIDEASEVVNFESISAKKLKQVSASYREFSGNIELQVGLKAADTQTATKVLSVAQGLLALKVLSETNQVVIDMLNAMQIEQDAENLKLILSGSVDSFKALLDHADI